MWTHSPSYHGGPFNLIFKRPMFQPQQTLLRVLLPRPLSPPTKFQLLDIFSGWTFQNNIETLPSESNLGVDSVCYSDNEFSVLAVHDFLSDSDDCVMVQTQNPSATAWVPLWLSLAVINMPILIWTWEQITLVSIFFFSFFWKVSLGADLISWPRERLASSHHGLSGVFNYCWVQLRIRERLWARPLPSCKMDSTGAHREVCSLPVKATARALPA